MTDVFVDTNILVYSRDSRDPKKQAAAIEWLEYLWRSFSGRLSIQVLTEFYRAVTEKLEPGLDRRTAREEVRDLLSWRPVPVDAAVLQGAWVVQDRHRAPWWDALIVSAAQVAGCSYLLSEDFTDGSDMGGIRIVNPFVHDPSAVSG